MPALNERDYAEFSRMVDELEPEIGSLDDVPQGFVRDMVDKKKQYGERMFVSPKQKAWIERLHEEFVGNSDNSGTKGIDGRDIDDDISF